MKKIAWITDSSAYIPNEMIGREDIYVVPLILILDGQEYRDGIDITEEELYPRLRTFTSPPKTSQPAIGDFVGLFNELKESYDAVIGIHISGALSGTISACQQAAEVVGLDMRIVDSKILAYPLTNLIERGIALNKEGKEVDEIVKQLQTIANSVEAYVLVGSLEQLQRSGRLNGIQYVIGNLLNIRPIITFNDGKLEVFEKKRSETKATNRIFEMLVEGMSKSTKQEIFILHANAEHIANQWKERILETYPHVNVLIGPLSSAVTLHAGEGTIGLVWFNE
ncbi:DegV family protein [Anaerobacillus isosaccharinicus]|uniref:DegV family protein n=1 Tax=Anaerobacillus isosaccharinicus TaxID=1532552 RepID=A0A1S2LRG3_9BACI|nr:DegV family protein [Anaerobacillus isosaccharinicus]MBA5586328.1 DegV family protein [Anaerobacillus isosaccharinicus]QOY35422.1 DegV family protein [Anaerobacillus isosaccharinicus]